ncbi:MAG: peptidoglycan recognition family protein [Reichenbachiella sp.]|uniref:N-acetylmuramoyl-L-alanine amidase n=1 Tax=Reichenbachiella sp. TaxID=2184521 RepID=UPI003266829E
MQIATIESQFGGGSQNPDKIIIHAMGEYIDNGQKDYHAKEWLDVLGLSAHYLVCPSGVIIQTRNIDQKTWHAKGHNTNTVGIEFLVSGLHTYGTFLEAIKRKYLTKQQYDAGVALCLQLKGKGLSKMDRHETLDPGRKFDPGKGFPWETFKNDVGL